MTEYHPMLSAVLALHQEGRLVEAIEGYKRILMDDPADANSLHLLAMAQMRSKENESGSGECGHSFQFVTLMRRALRSNAALIPAYINLSSLLHLRGERAAYRSVLRQWLAVEPDNPHCYEWLGRSYLATGRLDQATAIFERVAAGKWGSDRLGLARKRAACYRRIIDAAADPALPPGIVVRGVFRDGSGYAHKIRQFVRHLVAAGIAVQLIDLDYMPTDDLPTEHIDPLFNELGRPVRAKAILSFATPPVVEIVPGLLTINYSVFEAARIPDQWARYSQGHDRVLVATPSSKAAWVAAGCDPDRIDICPEGVDPIDPQGIVPFELEDTRKRKVFDYRTRFINISDFNPRKNLIGLLRVWLRATRNSDDAALVIKIGKGDDIAQIFARTVRLAVDQTGAKMEDVAPIFIVDGKFSDGGMLSLLTVGTHYWSMSHGEGWDLAMSQAAALDLTPIAPRHSAYTAYLDDETALFVPSPLGAAYHAYAGLDWWEPDEDAAVDLIRRVIDDPDRYRRSARARLCRDFSWETVTRHLIERLTACGAL